MPALAFHSKRENLTSLEIGIPLQRMQTCPVKPMRLCRKPMDLKSAPGCDVEGKDSGPLFVSLSPYNPFQNGDMAPLLDLLGYFEKMSDFPYFRFYPSTTIFQ